MPDKKSLLSQPFFSAKMLYFAGFLCSFPISTAAGKYIGEAVAQGGVIAIGLVLLILAGRGNERRFRGWFYNQPMGALIVVGLLTIVISALGCFKMTSFIKTAMLIAFFVLIPSSIPNLSKKQLLSGGLVFSLFTAVFMYLTRTEWNPNSICLYASSASLCAAAACFDSKKRFYRLLGVVAILLGIYVNYALGSRTATIALILPNVLFLMMSFGRLSVAALRGFMVLFAIILVLFSGNIMQKVVKIAFDNLGSKSLVAEFFLSDKSANSIDDDLLDRGEVWGAAYEVMIDNPLIGVGYGAEPPGGSVHGNDKRFRAHNAYLEIGYQCGILSMLVWGWFYLRIFDFSSSLVQRFPREPMVYLCFTMSCYLLLAGIMESSGMLSLAVAGNWIVICCFFFMYYRVKFCSFTKK